MTLFTSLPSIDTEATKAIGQKWMIIDGALINDAYNVLKTEFVKNKKYLQHQSLFLHTKWHDVADVGPILISYDKAIEEWAQAQQPWQFGLVFESDAPLKTLVTHWQTLMDCQHQGLEGSLCRLYDGIIFYHVLNQTEEARQATWLGPIKRLWIPDYAHKQYFYAQQPTVENAPLLEKVAFTDPEWQGLSDAKLYLSAHKLTEHVDEFFPEYWLDKADKHTHTVDQLTLLAGLGDVTQQGATYYMNILCRIGDIWDKENWKKAHPQNSEKKSPHETIVSLLEEHGTQTLTDKLETANQLALAYHLEELENKEATA